jgi:hypothetical protein
MWSLQIILQNVSVPTPIVSLLSLRVFDGCEPSVEFCQSLDDFRIACITETTQSMTQPGAAMDEHTVIVDTVDDLFPQSSITPGVLDPQRGVVHNGSQCTYPDVSKHDSVAQRIPWFVPSAVLYWADREVGNISEGISTYHVRTDGAVEVTTIPGNHQLKRV